MDLQYRKLSFIQEFIKLTDINLLDKFEKLLQQERKKMYEAELKPMSMKEYERRIDKGIDDYKQNRLTTAKKLKKEIASWK